MHWFSYLWRVVVNCFYLAVVVYVLDRLTNKPEAIVVAVLGLMYVTMRNVAIGQYLLQVGWFAHMNKQLRHVRKLLHDPHHEQNEQEWLEAERTVPQQNVKLYIDLGFLWLVGIFCLLVLFTSLPSKGY